MHRRLERLLPALLGAGSVVAFAPLAWFPLAWVTLGGLYLILCRVADSRAAMRAGLAFGLGLFGAGVSWIYVSLHDFGGMPAPLAALATLLFCATLAVFPAVVGGLFARWRRAGGWPNALLFAALWTLSEWLRGWLFTGFPWLAVGYSQTGPSPLAGYAPVVGVFGVSLLTTLVAVGLAEWLRRYFGDAGCRLPARWWARCSALPLLGAGVLLAGGELLGDIVWTTPQGAPVRVALLQGNVPQDLKWRPERVAYSLRIYYLLAAEHPATLTVLPETALPAFLDNLPPGYLDDLTKLVRDRRGDLLIGGVVGDRERYTNSVVSLGVSPRQTYSKVHLVPFGEFIPPGFTWVLTMLNIPMSEFSRGAEGQPPLAVGGQQVAMNICYEDVFGEAIIRALPAATILANVSNTAWFGRSLAQPQHLQIARMRALESGRPMLRATNTGMTAVIGVDGRVMAQLEPFTRGALVADVQGYQGLTPFAQFGNGPAVALAALALLPAVTARVLAGRRQKPIKS